jgi:hypothetical protein
MNTPRSDKAWEAWRKSGNAQHIRSESCRLETELAAVTDERDALKSARDRAQEDWSETARLYKEMKVERDALIRGEYVCKKCGIRKDGEGTEGDF